MGRSRLPQSVRGEPFVGHLGIQPPERRHAQPRQRFDDGDVHLVHLELRQIQLAGRRGAGPAPEQGLLRETKGHGFHAVVVFVAVGHHLEELPRNQHRHESRRGSRRDERLILRREDRAANQRDPRIGHVHLTEDLVFQGLPQRRRQPVELLVLRGGVGVAEGVVVGLLGQTLPAPQQILTLGDVPAVERGPFVQRVVDLALGRDTRIGLPHRILAAGFGDAALHVPRHERRHAARPADGQREVRVMRKALAVGADQIVPKGLRPGHGQRQVHANELAVVPEPAEAASRGGCRRHRTLRQLLVARACRYITSAGENLAMSSAI